MKFERIVAGIDFSAASVTAARWVADWFAPRAEMVLAPPLPEEEMLEGVELLRTLLQSIVVNTSVQ